MPDSFNWKCPYCYKETTIVASTNYSTDTHFYNSKSKDGYIGLQTEIIVCPNKNCKEYVIYASLFPSTYSFDRPCIIEDKQIQSWQLKPQSSAIPQPDLYSRTN